MLLAACGELVLPTAPGKQQPNHPGFDTSIYPGDVVMRAWSGGGSPFEWSGYYLPAPCHRDTSWSGRRSTLNAMGWGVTVIYVGQQTWEGVPQLSPDAAAGAGSYSRASVNVSEAHAGRPAVQSATCSRTLLNASQGTTDAVDAIAKTSFEGFPDGTVIFLDLERMQTIPASMRDYYRAWISRVLSDGRFKPGIYTHRFNADQVYTDARDVYSLAGAPGGPEFWIASSTGFDMTRYPTDVGLPYAAAWQGMLDVVQAWNGSAVNIDVSVARNRSPSLPDVPTIR